jgi:hypothetical protein
MQRNRGSRLFARNERRRSIEQQHAADIGHVRRAGASSPFDPR